MITTESACGRCASSIASKKQQSLSGGNVYEYPIVPATLEEFGAGQRIDADRPCRRGLRPATATAAARLLRGNSRCGPAGGATRARDRRRDAAKRVCAGLQECPHVWRALFR